MIKLERSEVYPFQRVAGHSTTNRSRWYDSRQRIKTCFSNWSGFSLNLDETKQRLQSILVLKNLLLAGAAVVFGRAFILGELLPFVFAFLAAFGRGDRGQKLLLAAGAAAGFFSVLSGFDLWINIITVAFLMIALSRAKIPESHSWWGIPVLTGTIIFVIKTLAFLKNDFTLYVGMIIVFEALISGVLTFVAMIAGEAVEERRSLAGFSFEERAAFMVMGIGLVMGLNDIHIAGLSIGGTVCRLGILMAAYLWGAGAGTMVGVMAGIIPSISSRIFAQSMGMYAISGLLAGMFRNFGQLGSIIGFMLGSLALSMFVTEDQAALIGIWETGVAALVFYILPSSWKEQAAVQSFGVLNPFETRQMQLAASQLEDITRNRMEDLVHIFEEMSSTLSQSKSAYNKQSYLAFLYDELSGGFCAPCPRHQRCWEREIYDTSRELMDVFSLAEQDGFIKADTAPDHIKKRCLNFQELLREINRLFDSLRINEYWQERFNQSRQLVSMQLKGISQVIKNLLEEMGAQAILNLEVRQAVIKEMNRLGIKVRDVSVLEQADRQLLLTMDAGSCSDGAYCENYIEPAVSAMLGEKLVITEKKCPRGRQKSCQVVYSRGFVYSVWSGAAQMGKESVCGDSFTIATLKQGKQLIALSDGMGVGEKAWRESQAAVRLLENLLSSGFDHATTLKTINSMLLLRSSAESFATLDIAMIDLYSGEVDFIKIGSAPSFIKHGRKITTIVSSSPPIGILEDINLVRERRELKVGEMLVLVSDGVLETHRKGREENWIPGYLASLDESDPQKTAELLIQKALGFGRGKPVDDMTVICARLELSHND